MSQKRNSPHYRKLRRKAIRHKIHIPYERRIGGENSPFELPPEIEKMKRELLGGARR